MAVIFNLPSWCKRSKGQRAIYPVLWVCLFPALSLRCVVMPPQFVSETNTEMIWPFCIFLACVVFKIAASCPEMKRLGRLELEINEFKLLCLPACSALKCHLTMPVTKDSYHIAHLVVLFVITSFVVHLCGTIGL